MLPKMGQSCRIPASPMQPEAQPSVQLGSAKPKRLKRNPADYPTVKVRCAKGVRLLPIKTSSGTRAPYGVIWDTGGGKRKSQFFETIEKLEQKIVALNAAKREGNIKLMPTADETVEWRLFKTKAGNYSPLDILTEWKALRMAAGKAPCEITVAKGVDDFLARQKQRVEKGRITLDHHRQQRAKLLKFQLAFGDKKLDEISSDDIEEWIDGLEEVDADTTRNDHIKKVRDLYSHYSKIVAVNPAATLELGKNQIGIADRVMPVRSVAKLFEFAMKHRPHLLPRLAAEFFAGVRFSTAQRITQANIKIAERELDFEGLQMKGRRPHYISSAPERMWTWITLGFNDRRCWQMKGTEYMHAKSALFDACEITNPRNTARHSFASYHVAAFLNPVLTSLIMAHRSQQKLWDTYRSKAKRADARLYFSLTPQNVAHVASGAPLPEADQISLPPGREFGAVDQSH